MSKRDIRGYQTLERYDLITALAKHRPRKPIEIKADTYACSDCDYWLLYVGQNYCHECGQRIDWSDDNE